MMCRVWPLLGTYDYRSLVTPDGVVVIILRDRRDGVITGSFKARPLERRLAEALAPESVVESLERLRVEFALGDDGALFALPIRTVSGPDEILRRWRTENVELLAAQLAWNIQRHIGVVQPSPAERRFLLHGTGKRPALNDTEREIAELVWTEGPLTAIQIADRLPPALKVTDGRVRTIFSRKLTRHYGFDNPRGGVGYRAPKERTWDSM